MDLQRAPAHKPPRQLLDLGLQKVVGLRSAEHELEVAVIDRANLGGEVQAIALPARLAVAGHAEEHAHLARYVRPAVTSGLRPISAEIRVFTARLGGDARMSGC